MELGERILDTLLADFADLGDVEGLVRALLRFLMAILLGGLLGYEREVKGKSAGMRTHMLVCLGATLFVMALEQDGAGHDAISRVIQGITAGIGFLCAGTILKGRSPADVKGLTTAAGIWSAAAIGVAVGLGREATAVLATLLALMVLHVLPLLVDPAGNGKNDQEKE
ncbi:MgtC/SapB family protein [Pseudomonas sp. JS3066]|jgi:putative Mg2+ transporter-C (MgtC) family protein|uniref:MgtC/SapB family protein n=1 Tax=unclassified Pseudomonas TaxID=196821 RepID=UPI000EAA594F|nr:MULTISPECIES: MgtC/SapB family protein [unclassified Pseudomonas]AYF86731.1 MgtC/SapB family protein [Pseudomonas sp. DY-1]MRK22021.1 MgtC/SapB family protein [Pseudomonas sp. JG-B]WVK95799.1 MgtC/SapB family protein [Pseudomonas sp. JS3066]